MASFRRHSQNSIYGLRQPSAVVLLVTLSFLLFRNAISMKVNVEKRCPDKCTEDVVGLFETCAPLVSKGCTFSKCSNVSYACTMKESGPDYFELSETISFKNFHINETLSVPLSLGSVKPNVDIYLLMDATFTNRGLLREAQDSYPVFMDDFSKLAADPEFGAGIFRDESELWNGFSNLQGMTEKKSAVTSALGKAEGTGGLDYFESNLVALYLSTIDDTIDWRKSSRKFVVMVAGFVGHEPTCTGDLPKLDRENVAKALQKSSIVPIIYSPGNGMNAPTVPYGCIDSKIADGGQGSYIAKFANGELIGGKENGKELKIGSILESIKSLFYKVNVDTSDCDKILDVSTNVTASHVVSYGDGIELQMKMTNELCRKINGGIPQGRCTIEIDIEGVRIQTIAITLDQYTGCPGTFDPLERPVAK